MEGVRARGVGVGGRPVEAAAPTALLLLLSPCQTEAVLDLATDEWVVNTPDDAALKWWIGNAAEDGQMATVFARLKIPSPGGAVADHGVHAFVVPIRDGRRGEAGLLPGVQILDCGYKVRGGEAGRGRGVRERARGAASAARGRRARRAPRQPLTPAHRAPPRQVGLQGVDNGALRFTDVRIPRDHLLDRFATVDARGAYASPHTPGKRFAATLGELTGGRVGLTGSSVAVLKAALTVAIRYSATRVQFGPPGGPEVAVLDYPSQQDRLMPALATAYGLHFASRTLVRLYVAAKAAPADDAVADVHSLSAGLKAYATRFTAGALSTCRECCGGHGYAAANRMGAWRSDHDIFQTFEGDNTVLLQQVAGLLLKRYKDRFSSHPLAASTAYVRAWAGRALPANPLLAHDTSPAHLRNRAFLRAALRHRARRLLFTAAARLAKHTKRVGAFAAWSKCLPHLLHLATAHVEAVIHDELAAGAAAAPTAGGARAALTAAADLFALDRIEADIMFRNDEFVAADKAKAISKVATALKAQLRGAALPMVAAFSIPDAILRAPIGVTSVLTDPYKAYLRSTGFDC